MSASNHLAIPRAGGFVVPPSALRTRSLLRRVTAFGRLRPPSTVTLLIEALVEARGMALAAHRRFPFADY